MNLKNMTVRAKLALAFGGLALLVLAASGMAINDLNNANKEFVSYVSGIDTRAHLVEQIHIAVGERAVAVRNMVLTTNPAALESEKATAVKSHELVHANLAKLKEMIASNDIPDNIKAMVSDIDKIEQTYTPVALAIVDLAANNKREEAINKINNECIPLLHALSAKANVYAEATAARSQAILSMAQARYENQRNTLIIVCALALLGAVIAGALITINLSKALGSEPSTLGEIAQRVAQGDLSSMEASTSAPAGSVLASLKIMQQNLVEIVSKVRQASNSIATGATEISTGNLDLSSRTEQQAGSLEETAAAMEELTSTVKQNAENANQASQLATSASQVASEGGNVVNQVITTM